MGGFGNVCDLGINQNSWDFKRLEISNLENQIKTLELEKDSDRETIKSLHKIISTLTKTNKEQTKKILKLLEMNKVELNKDKYTFEQYFNLKCPNRSIFGYLKTFLKAKPTWENLTTTKLEQFSIWLHANSEVKESTASNYCVQLKNVINQGYSNSANASSAIKTIKAPKEKSLWLRPSQINAIMDYKPTNEDEKYVRKMFLICALTGCRILDASELSESNIESYTLRYIPIKTNKKECFVPMTKKAKTKLLELFSEGVIPTKKDKYKILKSICEGVGLTHNVSVGTPKKPRMSRLCDEVTFHTARKSYATIKYRYSDLSDRQLADAMGHTEFKQTLDNYIIDKTPVSAAEMSENRDELFN